MQKFRFSHSFAFIHHNCCYGRRRRRPHHSSMDGITLYETAVCCVASLHLLIVRSMLPQSTKTKQRVFGWLLDKYWRYTERESEKEFA